MRKPVFGVSDNNKVSHDAAQIILTLARLYENQNYVASSFSADRANLKSAIFEMCMISTDIYSSVI